MASETRYSTSIPLIYISSLDHFYGSLSLIKCTIEKNGFTILQVWDSEVSTIKFISQTLGTIQSHIRSDSEGITGQFDSKYSSWKDFKNEYQGVSKGMFSPHTDGTFLDGMFPIQNAMIKIGPPKMILLQLIEYDAVGG